MMTPVHCHLTIRKLCELDLPDDVVARLETPEALKSPFVAEDHVVKVATPLGELVLFKVKANGVPLVVTPTSDIAIALAASIAA